MANDAVSDQPTAFRLGLAWERHRPEPIGLGTALAVLAFFVTRVISARSDEAARWLAQARLANESAAIALIDDLGGLLAVAGVLALLTAWRLFAWGGYGIVLAALGLLWGASRWAPARAVANALARAVSPAGADGQLTAGDRPLRSRQWAYTDTATYERTHRTRGVPGRAVALVLGILWIALYWQIATLLARDARGLAIFWIIGGVIALPAIFRHVLAPLSVLVRLLAGFAMLAIGRLFFTTTRPLLRALLAGVGLALLLLSYPAEAARYLRRGVAATLRFFGRMIVAVVRPTARLAVVVLSVPIGGLALVVRYAWLVVGAIGRLGWLAIAVVGRSVRLSVVTLARLTWLAVAASGRFVWLVLATVGGSVWLAVATIARFVWLVAATAGGFVWFAVATVGRFVWLVVAAVVRSVWLAVATIARIIWLAVVTLGRFVWLVVAAGIRYAWLAVATPGRYLWLGLRLVIRTIVTISGAILGLSLAAIAAVVGALAFGLRILVAALQRAVGFPLRYLWLATATLALAVGSGLRAVGSIAALGLSAVLRSIAVPVRTIAALVARVLRHRATGPLVVLGATVAVGASVAIPIFGMAPERLGALGGAVVTELRLEAIAAAAALIVLVVFGLRFHGAALSAFDAAGRLLGKATFLVVAATSIPLRYLWLGVVTLLLAIRRVLLLVFSVLVLAVVTPVRLTVLGLSVIFDYLKQPLKRAAAALSTGLRLSVRYLWLGLATLFLAVRAILVLVLRLLWSVPSFFIATTALGMSTLLGAGWSAVRFISRRISLKLRASFLRLGPAPEFLPRPLWIVLATILVGFASAVWLVGTVWRAPSFLIEFVSTASSRKQVQGVPTMSSLAPARDRMLAVVWTVWLLGGVFLVAFLWPKGPDPVIVSHWANIYPMDAKLMPTFARDFNGEGRRVQSGRRIEVKPVLINSGLIKNELVSLASTGRLSGECNQAAGGCPKDLMFPTIVTPAADHWLPQVNYEVGRTVVDLANTKTLMVSYVTIIMQRDMARCLGWPAREIGISDIVALRDDPRGWGGACPNPKTEWGQRPLMSFTDPSSSSTGRSMLYSLYAIGAGKAPADLTPEDVTNPEVVEYVRRFQQAVDHYVPDTVALASKVYEGPRFGHFFFMIENQLFNLYQGRQSVTERGDQKPRPLRHDMVAIYPREGAITHRNSAAIVQAPWVDAEQVEAARQWIDYLLEEPRQQAFVEAGFRPATNVPFAHVINPSFGLDPTKPTLTVDPDRVNAAAAKAMADSWGEVKKPGVAAFVIDTSGSMRGEKLEQAKEGFKRALDNMASANLVGLITFSDTVHTRVPEAALTENRYRLAEAADQMRAAGETALYDAIIEGIAMADAAAPELDAIRGVVVLTDGKANRGRPLDRIVRLISKDERPIRSCPGFESDKTCPDDRNQPIARKDLVGSGLVVRTEHPIHIFFVGIGADADLDVGCALAEATASTCTRATEQGLAAVLERFGLYF